MGIGLERLVGSLLSKQGLGAQRKLGERKEDGPGGYPGRSGDSGSGVLLTSMQSPPTLPASSPMLTQQGGPETSTSSFFSVT